jgi:hypothetical protein
MIVFYILEAPLNAGIIPHTAKAMDGKAKSASIPKADICGRPRDVRFGPKPEVGGPVTATNKPGAGPGVFKLKWTVVA